MEKDVLIYASFVNQKYFFNPEYKGIPEDIQKQLKVICITLSNELKGAFSVGYYEDGSIYISSTDEEDVGYDHIGANLEVKKLKETEKELFTKLTLWYRLFKDEDGEKLRKELLDNDLGDL